jgi:hypothetical protein
MGKTKKQVIIVLGMHRSGTSALTGVLTCLGAPEPKTPMEAHDINAKGFFESDAIKDINNELLQAARLRWRDWLPIKLETPALRALQPRIHDVFDQEFGEADFIAIKDPRICRLLPLWLPVLKDKGYDTFCVIPYRHPLEVAESLRARYNMPLSDGLLLWLRYVLDAEWQSRELPRVFTPMAELLEDWRACIDRIGKALNVVWPVDPEQAATEIDGFLDKDLKHQNLPLELFESDPLLQGWISVTYAALHGMCKADTPAWRLRLDAVREAIDDASHLFGPSVVEKLSRISKIQTRLNELQDAPTPEQMSALEHQVSHLSAQIEDARQALAQSDGVRVEQLAAIEALEGRNLAQTSAADALNLNIEILSQTLKDLTQKHEAARVAAEAETFMLRETSEMLKAALTLAKTAQSTLISAHEDLAKANVKTNSENVLLVTERDAAKVEHANLVESLRFEKTAQTGLHRHIEQAEARMRQVENERKALVSKYEDAKARYQRDLADFETSQAEYIRQIDSLKTDYERTSNRLSAYLRAGRLQLLKWVAKPATRP